MSAALYEKCGDCHLFVEPNIYQGEGVAEYVHLHRGDEEDEALDATHDASPSGMLATLATWQAFGPPQMRARFGDVHPIDRTLLTILLPEEEGAEGTHYRLRHRDGRTVVVDETGDLYHRWATLIEETFDEEED